MPEPLPNSRPHGKPQYNKKKQIKSSVRPVKARRMSEKQKVEAVDKLAMEYIAPDDLKLFADLPISENTKRGLKKAFFVEMTEVQAKSLPISLKGKDVLGAARTGSGKTLAFLIPVLEILYRRKWGPTDGLGALIISPTRELAVQIFDVLRSIGGYHAFSAGLVIGGKNLKDERDRLTRMNILVATPGRLLQHMDQTVGFDADNLQMLVLDEADRILDMGFQRTLAALLSHLPKSRQTLLFSATQTSSVSDLARLSLNDPVSVNPFSSASGDASTSTNSDNYIPPNLEQHYAICTLDQKLSVLWSFIKTHLQSKTIVFLSSCKQVRFVYETFCRMHPGVPLIHLHGKQKQSARLTMYQKFTATKHAVLIATDIAARGLDFPSVDWVVQVDAPEDVETYIHRVGRTARYERKGKALILLLPSEEEGMVKALESKNLKVAKIKIKTSKTQSIDNQLQKLAFQDPEIKYLGQRAFVSYLRSIYLQKNKSIFKLEELPTEEFAESLGLPGAPKIKFLSKEIAKKRKNASRTVEAAEAEVAQEKEEMKTRKRKAVVNSDEDSDDESDVGIASESEKEDSDSDTEGNFETADSDSEAEGSKTLGKQTNKTATVRTKYDRMFERKNQNILSEHYSKLIDHDPVSDDDDFITLKRADHDLSEIPTTLPLNDDHHENLSKRKQKMGRAKRALITGGTNTKLIFDDEGEAHPLYELEDGDKWFEKKGGLGGAEEEGKKFALEERMKMLVTDVVDREQAKEKKQEKKRKRKDKEKSMGDDGGPIAYLGATEDDGYVSPDFDLPSESEDEAPSPQNKKRRVVEENLDDEEELALRLLSRR